MEISQNHEVCNKRCLSLDDLNDLEKKSDSPVGLFGLSKQYTVESPQAKTLFKRSRDDPFLNRKDVIDRSDIPTSKPMGLFEFMDEKELIESIENLNVDGGSQKITQRIFKNNEENHSGIRNQPIKGKPMGFLDFIEGAPTKKMNRRKRSSSASRVPWFRPNENQDNKNAINPKGLKEKSMEVLDFIEEAPLKHVNASRRSSSPSNLQWFRHKENEEDNRSGKDMSPKGVKGKSRSFLDFTPEDSNNRLFSPHKNRAEAIKKKSISSFAFIEEALRESPVIYRSIFKTYHDSSSSEESMKDETWNDIDRPWEPREEGHDIALDFIEEPNLEDSILSTSEPNLTLKTPVRDENELMSNSNSLSDSLNIRWISVCESDKNWISVTVAVNDPNDFKAEEFENFKLLIKENSKDFTFYCVTYDDVPRMQELIKIYEKSLMKRHLPLPQNIKEILNIPCPSRDIYKETGWSVKYKFKEDETPYARIYINPKEDAKILKMLVFFNSERNEEGNIEVFFNSATNLTHFLEKIEMPDSKGDFYTKKEFWLPFRTKDIKRLSAFLIALTEIESIPDLILAKIKTDLNIDELSEENCLIC